MDGGRQQDTSKFARAWSPSTVSTEHEPSKQDRYSEHRDTRRARTALRAPSMKTPRPQSTNSPISATSTDQHRVGAARAHVIAYHATASTTTISGPYRLPKEVGGRLAIVVATAETARRNRRESSEPL